MALPSWWNDKGQRQNARSKQQEKKRAKQVGGKTQPGSGSSWRAAGDVQTVEHLEELKYTDGKAFVLKVKDWYLIKKKATVRGREARMVIDFPTHKLRLIVEEEPYPDG